MQASLRLAPVPRVAWLLIVLALLVALGAMALAVGSRPRPADPFGLARNGAVAYGADGDIFAVDPATGASKAIVTGATIDAEPLFSRDGSRFVFVRDSDPGGRLSLMAANADGSAVRQLTEPLVNLDWFEWSPDGTRLAVISDLQAKRTLWILGLDGTALKILDVGMRTGSVQWRPDGRELVFRGVTSGTYGLYAVGTDGTGLRAIAPATPSDTDWMDLALSPDGTKIAYARWVDHGVIHVVDVDTGLDRTPVFDGTTADLSVRWSPDGTRLVFQRYFGGYFHLVVAPATGGPVVLIGPAMLEGTGGANAEFSPDGTKLIARYEADGSTWILDATGGLGERVQADISALATWQRLAP